MPEEVGPEACWGDFVIFLQFHMHGGFFRPTTLVSPLVPVMNLRLTPGTKMGPQAVVIATSRSWSRGLTGHDDRWSDE